MKKALRPAFAVLLTMIAALAVLILVSYVNHRVQLAREGELFIPTGTLVEVDGHRMHVHVEGGGERTLVFMSGGGTSSPVLDFRTLYSLLSPKYEIVVVEKAGYGFSDVTNTERDIDTILAETRQALAATGTQGPYVLLPHSMSGIEALHWARLHPDEVEAIIGLDMAVPGAYEEQAINMPLVRLAAFAARVGVTRWIPGAAESDAMRSGTLTEAEKRLYRAVFYRRTLTRNMVDEVGLIRDNARVVEAQGIATLPMLLFSSDGQGTGWDAREWLGFQRAFVADQGNSELVELDGSHYVHNGEHERIAEEAEQFLDALPSPRGGVTGRRRDERPDASGAGTVGR